MADLKTVNAYRRVDKQGLIARLARKFWKPTSPMWLWRLAYSLERGNDGKFVYFNEDGTYSEIETEKVNHVLGIALNSAKEGQVVMVSGSISLGDAPNKALYVRSGQDKVAPLVDAPNDTIIGYAVDGNHLKINIGKSDE